MIKLIQAQHLVKETATEILVSCKRNENQQAPS